MPVHNETHTYAHLHTPRRMNTQSIAWMIHLFCLLHGCFHSSSLWNCNKTTYACLRVRLLKSIEECVGASPIASAILAPTTPEDAAEYISKRPPALSSNGICTRNDSATYATTTPEDAADCVSERPSSGRPHQVRTASVQGTIRPSRPRQRPTTQPTASPSGRLH